MFDYFYGEEADKFTFIRIPKELITNSYFSKLSSDSKILYGIMLDRMSLSRKNGWLDAYNRVFIKYSLANIMEDLNVSKNTAIKIRKALDDETGIGLIHIEHQENGLPAVIYVKNFMSAIERSIGNQDASCNNLSKKRTCSKNEQGVVQKVNSSPSSKNEQPPVQNLHPNNININNTVFNKTKRKNTHLSSENDLIKKMEEEREDIETQIKSNIGYQYFSKWNDILDQRLDEHKISLADYDNEYVDTKTIDFLVNTMVNYICTKSEKWFSVGDETVPKSIVDKKLLSIGKEEIVSVARIINSKKVRNKKNYAITCLFNT